MPKLSVAFAVSVGAVSLFAPALARAHFALNFDPTKTPTMSPNSPQSWWTQQNDGTPQKMAPCGNEGAANTAASGYVMKVQPGATVPVLVRQTISHPGWYRISLKEGASSTQTTTSLPDPATLGAAGSTQQCTPAFINNPVWSTTQPVLADKLGLPAGSTSTTTVQSGTATYNVTIPSSANCTMASPCTLQVLMFMTDHPAGSCNYHHCADIAVVSTGTGGAGGASGAGGSGAGGTTGGGGRGGAGGSGAGGRGGSAGGSTGSAGTTGTAGSTGTAGDAGTTGTAGTTGGTGTAGTTGGTGTAGNTGTTGTSGTTGGTGTAGTTGGTGTAGTTGTAGAAGSTGTTGSAGSTGTSGAAGTTGEGSSGGCRVAGETGGGAPSIGAAILLAALVIRRRRRRRPSS